MESKINQWGNQKSKLSKDRARENGRVMMNKLLCCRSWRKAISNGKRNIRRAIRSLKMCDRKECRGKFKRHYYSISLIFMHNNYLFFLFSMGFSSWDASYDGGGDFWRRQCAKAEIFLSFIIFHISKNSFSSTQKAIRKRVVGDG